MSGHARPGGRPGIVVLALAVTALAGAGCSGNEGGALPGALPPGGTWIDLTHSFDETAVYWPTADTFKLEEVFRGMTDGGFYYSANNFAAAEHGGTHIDAPVHFAEGMWNVDEIPLDRLMGPAAVVDVSQEALADPDYLVGVADFQAWEAAHGRMPDGAIVLLNTGFTRYWPDRPDTWVRRSAGRTRCPSCASRGWTRKRRSGW
jgi:kynurenine formamidase